MTDQVPGIAGGRFESPSTPAQRSAAAEATSDEATAAYAARLAAAETARAEAEARAALAEAGVKETEAQTPLTPGQQTADQKFAADYVAWINGDYQNAMNQLTQLESALRTIQSGQQLSGPIVGRLPTFVQQILYGDDPQKIKSNVQEVAVGTLRQILGSQFTEPEGVRISNMSYDETLDEASNIEKILQTIAELRGRTLAKQAAAEYFGQNGTLAGFNGIPYQRSGAWDQNDVRQAERSYEAMFGAPAQETVWEQRAREEPTSAMQGGERETYVSALARQQAAALEEAWRNGATAEEMQAIAQSFGSPPLDPAVLQAAEEERAKGEQGRPVRFIPFESERPLSSELKGAAADNPITGPAMAFMAATAPTAAMDEFAGAVGGSPEQTNFELDYLQSRYPTASLLGDITGNLGYTLLGGGALRGLGMSPLNANLLAETGIGALRGGFGARENERLAGTLLGAGEGAIYGAVPMAASRMFNPQTPASVTQMREAGVPLSFGQTLGYPNAEATLARVAPGGGDIAVAAQRRAFEAFPEVQINRGLAEINARLPEGLTPTQRMGEAQRLFDDAYEAAKSNIQVRLDGDMRGDVFDFRNRLGAGVEFSEENARRLSRLLDDEIVRRVGTNPSGETYKELDTLLGERRAAAAADGNNELVRGIDDMQSMLRNSARRNSAPEDIARLDAVDRGYSQQILAEEAARRAGTGPGEFSPQQLLTAAQMGDATARGRRFARGEARGQDFAMTGVEALGPKAPNVTALERGLGLAAGTTVGLPINAALGLANAPGFRPILNTLVAGQRPDWLQRAGRAVAETPAYVSGPISSMPLASEIRSAPPSDIEALLAEYGVNPEPIAPTDLAVGTPADLDALQRKYEGQDAVRPLTIGLPPVAAAPPAPAVNAAAPSTAQTGVVNINGRPARYDEATDRFLDVETGEPVDEGYKHGGRVKRRPVPARALKG